MVQLSYPYMTIEKNIALTIRTFAYQSVPLLSCTQLFATPWTAACQASMSITNSQSLPKLMSTESLMLSNHLILCCPLLPPSFFLSIRVFSNESALCIRWPKYWSFSFTISPSNEHSGLISFRMDWLNLLAVQGTLKNLIHHSTSQHITSQLIHHSKLMSLLFKMLSRFVRAFLPRGKHLLISWLQSPSAVIFGPQENKICHCFHFSPFYLP